MKKTVVLAAAAYNVGKKRDTNEDNYLINDICLSKENSGSGLIRLKEIDLPRQVYAVCDGMGGLDCGEKASGFAVQELLQYYRTGGSFCDVKMLHACLNRISDQIHLEAEISGQHSGTTLALIAIEGEKVCFTNVGDSRIYRLRKGKLRQISVDQSEVQRLVSMGKLRQEEARTHPRKNVIYQFLGKHSETSLSPRIEVNSDLNRGDIYLLCSDGLTDMVEDQEIRKIIQKADNVSGASDNLVKAALANGGKDNVTVILLQIKQIKQRIWRQLGNLAFTIALCLCGCALLLGLTDLIYYLISRR